MLYNGTMEVRLDTIGLLLWLRCLRHGVGVWVMVRGRYNRVRVTVGIRFTVLVRVSTTGLA